MAAPDPAELPKVIDLASREAASYLESIADRNVRGPRAEELAASFRGDLPEDGVGAERALEELVAGFDGAVHSAGPRFFHFVNGAPPRPRWAPTGSRARSIRTPARGSRRPWAASSSGSRWDGSAARS